MTDDVKRRDIGPSANGTTTSGLISSLREVLGARLVSVIANEKDAVVEAWQRGEAVPSVAAVDRLRIASTVAEMLLEVEHPTIVRAWFAGLNPMLGDRPPAVVINEDAGAFMGAAREFRAYG